MKLVRSGQDLIQRAKRAPHGMIQTLSVGFAARSASKLTQTGGTHACAAARAAEIHERALLPEHKNVVLKSI